MKSTDKNLLCEASLGTNFALTTYGKKKATSFITNVYTMINESNTDAQLSHF